ncbi:hypothetical protein H6768_03520 [Candidatus Peribacteria bacterium]|nr:hypothetical protein [Candidatus Peribacteria bacterium]
MLKAISVRPELANDRDWMNSLRQTLNHIIISPDLAQKITQLSRMDDSLRHALQSEL